MYQLLRGSDVIIETSNPIVWDEEHQAWLADGILYPDNESELVVNPAIAAQPNYPKVGPIHFQMLFAPAEMVAAEELKATDKVLASFWKLIDDPRTDTVDLALVGVQNAIEYTLTVVKAAGVELDVQARKAQILTGALQ